MLPAFWKKRLVDLNVTNLTLNDLAWADYVYISAMIVQRDAARLSLPILQMGVPNQFMPAVSIQISIKPLPHFGTWQILNSTIQSASSFHEGVPTIVTFAM